MVILLSRPLAISEQSLKKQQEQQNVSAAIPDSLRLTPRDWHSQSSLCHNLEFGIVAATVTVAISLPV